MEVSYALWAALLMLAEVALAKDYYKVINRVRTELLLCFITLQTVSKVAVCVRGDLPHKQIY